MIDGIDFSTLEIEKYWDFPKSYKGNKREFVKECIFSEDYIGSLKKDGEFHRIIKESMQDYIRTSHRFRWSWMRRRFHNSI